MFKISYIMCDHPVNFYILLRMSSNTGASKMQDMKLKDMKKQQSQCGREIPGNVNARHGHC